MAQPELSPFTQRGVAVKLEVTEGEDSLPTGAANGILMLDGQSGTEFDRVERNVDRPFFGGRPFGVANKRAFIEGDIELFAPATPGQASTSDSVNHVLLLVAGMTAVKDALGKTTTYNPITNNIQSASAYFWHVDVLKKLLGARANISQLSMEVGNRFRARVRLQGAYEDVTTESVPAITTYTDVPVIIDADNSETLLDVPDYPGAAIVDLLTWSKALTVDFGSRLTSKQYTSKKKNAIDGRDPTFTWRIAKTALADFNPWTARDSGLIIQLSIRVMETDVLWSELGVRGQIETINEVDIDGDYGFELTGPCVPSSAGGDEFYIRHGDDTP